MLLVIFILEFILIAALKVKRLSFLMCRFQSAENKTKLHPLVIVEILQRMSKNTEYYELKYANHSFDNYTFYFGGYLPWQPYLKSNNNECRLTINEDLKL